MRVTINDNWEVSPEAPDASEPPTLYLGRYIGHLNEKKQPHGKGNLSLSLSRMYVVFVW